MPNETQRIGVEAMSDKSTTGITNLLPILASLLFGMLCAYLILTSAMETYSITPFPEGTGSIGNAVYFVVLAGVGAFLLFLLLKRKSLKLISWITGFALTAAVFMLSLVYLSAAFSAFEFPYLTLLILVLTFLITSLAYLAIFRLREAARNITVLCIGGALGAFLGAMIPTLSTLLILGFLAAYDVYAVYRGAVGKIARNGLDQLRGLSFSFKDVQMGLGDLTFYSMLSGHMLINFGAVSSLASIVGILLGCMLTFKMLEKKEMFPGLPFPIAFGLTAGFLAAKTLF
jgi:hypothetical protein